MPPRLPAFTPFYRHPPAKDPIGINSLWRKEDPRHAKRLSTPPFSTEASCRLKPLQAPLMPMPYPAYTLYIHVYTLQTYSGSHGWLRQHLRAARGRCKQRGPAGSGHRCLAPSPFPTPVTGAGPALRGRATMKAIVQRVAQASVTGQCAATGRVTGT